MAAAFMAVADPVSARRGGTRPARVAKPPILRGFVEK